MEELRKAVASATERFREGIGQELFQAGTARGARGADTLREHP
jgi:hypothetical protein